MCLMGDRRATNHSTRFRVAFAGYVFMQDSSTAALVRIVRHMGYPCCQLILKRNILEDPSLHNVLDGYRVEVVGSVSDMVLKGGGGRGRRPRPRATGTRSVQALPPV